MKKTSLFLASLLISISLFAQELTVETVFEYTGAVQEFVVPYGVTYITIEAWGAEGSGDEGKGGYVSAELTVTPGEALKIYIGGKGVSATGGYNGGGNGYSSAYGAGGGASDVRRDAYTLNDRIIVAGGGGGSGSNCGPNTAEGGHGGDVIGMSGCVFSCSNCQFTGGGGTQTTGGIAGPTSHQSCGGNNNGVFGIGGSNTSGTGGTAGGGGWYGGGSGCYEGAGGGSSYTNSSASNIVHIQGYNTGHGQVIITYIPTEFGCSNETASNYEPYALEDDGSCLIYGCTLPIFPNYNALANIDDASCDMASLNVFGCTDAMYFEYEELANVDNGNCTSLIIYGCTDSTMFGYNPIANFDDASCVPILEGCLDSTFVEYNSEANVDNGSCASIALYGCMDATAFNFNPEANVEAECIAVITGCLDSLYTEFIADANTDDGSCEILVIEGCTNPSYLEYWNWSLLPNGYYTVVGPLLEGVNTDDGSCASPVTLGCIYDVYAEYNDNANVFVVDSCQTLAIWGCTNSFAINYYAPANQDDGSCYSDTMAINLNAGWSMVSSYINVSNHNHVELMAPIVEDLLIVKDNQGAVYMPEFGFSGIENWNIGEAYQVKMSNSRSLNLYGAQISPEQNPISLNEGWNMIAYLRVYPADTELVLEDISDEVLIIKNDVGEPYLPEWGFNAIGDMEPGEGYQVKLNEAVVLEYLSNDLEYRTTESYVVDNRAMHYPKVKISSNNMIVGIPAIVLNDCFDGDEIAAYDAQGVLVGSAVYNNPISVITLWGDDATTDVKDGLFIGEAFTFELWHAETNEVESFEIVDWESGAATYELDGISLAASVEMIATSEMVSVQLLDAIPNPARNSTSIQFYLPESNAVSLNILNILGEVVEVISGDFEAGYQSVSLDLTKYNAGAYFYQLQTADFVKAKQLHIVK